jgi:outer membrane protein TolC
MFKRLIWYFTLSAALTLAWGPEARAQAVTTEAPATVLTYEKALARLRESHEALRAADEQIAQRREERAATRGLYWPKVELKASATHLDEEVELDLDPIRQVILKLHGLPASVIPSFISTFQKQDFWLSELETVWPVYTGGKIRAANHAAALQIEDAEQQKAITADALTTDLARRYFALRLAIRARDVRAEVVKSLDRHVYEAKRLEEEGMVARAERLHAEVARAKAVRELQAAEQDVALARTALANILSTSDTVEPESELFLLKDIGPMEPYIADALGEHPGLKRLGTQRNLAGEALKVEKSKWKPTVALFGMRELHTDDLSIVSPTWAAGVSASFTLFDGFDREHRIAAAKRQQARVDLLETRARRDISTLVEQKYRTLTKAREQYVSLDSALELSTEMVRVRSRAFDEGFSTSVEVVDAQVTLQGVRLQRLLAAYDFDVALAELLEATGQPGRYTDLRQRADLFPER